MYLNSLEYNQIMGALGLISTLDVFKYITADIAATIPNMFNINIRCI